MESETTKLKKRKFKPIFMVMVMLPLLAALAFPQVAFADDDDQGFDPIGAITGWIGDRAGDLANTFLAPACAGMAEGNINDAFSQIKRTTTKSILGKNFSELLGKKTGNFYTTVESIHKKVVVPIAGSILSLIMLMQLIKISQRIDGTATLPAVKDIVFLLVFAVLFTWLIKNSVNICAGAYDTFNQLISGDNSISQVKVDAFEKISIDEEVGNNFGTAGSLFVTSIVMRLAAIAINGSVSVMCYMRAMQLYIYAALSPIPFALLGFDETKSYGVGFCKNFIAVCLSGAVIMLALTAFPSLVSFKGGAIKGISTDMWSSIFACLAMTLAVIKSGSIARDILGG